MTAATASLLQVGEQAPDITLKDQHGTPVTLSDEVAQGRRALLVFFPFAFSSICTNELLEIQLNIDRFDNDRVRPYGVSCDASFALKAWAAHEGYRFPLLSDFWPHGAAARAWGVFDQTSGMARRGTFLVSPSREVVWSLVHEGDEARDVDVLHRAVRDL